jgi:hypothetical protein
LRRFSIGGPVAFSFLLFVCSDACRGNPFREDALGENASWEGTVPAVPRSFAKTSAVAPEVSVLSISTITTQSANRTQEGVTPATSQPQPTTCDTLRTSKSKVYGFRPTQRNESQIDAKGKEIDAFWKQVHSAGSDGVSCVRSMLLPRSSAEFADVMGKKGAEFDQRMRDSKATQEQISTAIAEGEPTYGIANHAAFMNSAVATRQPGDFELLRTARRKALFNVSDQSLEEYLAFTQVMIGLINRLDLYKEFRSH